MTPKGSWLSCRIKLKGDKLKPNQKVQRVAAFLFGTFLLFVGCATAPKGQRIDNIPMYGQPDIQRPDFLKKADEDFISQASGGFSGDRKAASDAWHAQAEKYMNKGDLDFAMRRYNQAWLLNPDSYKPYWGFARVMVAQGEFDEAFKYFEKAKQLINDRCQEGALLADIGVGYHHKANIIKNDQQKRTYYFALANQSFKESTDIDPTYPLSWRSWAFSLYFEGKYDEAWEKTKKAKSLDPNVMPARFLKDLRRKMPEPK